MTQTQPTYNIKLRERLGSRLLPLVFLLALVLSLSAPTAYLMLRFRSLRQQARSFAQQIVSFIQREAHQQPVMWRYDASKILQHIHSYYAPKQLQCIHILDQGRRRVVQRCAAATHSQPVWGMAPITIGQHQKGQVWVSMSSDQARTYTLLLLLCFTALGSLLGWLLYTIPHRTVAQAEQQLIDLFSRLTQTQQELQELNHTLESQVSARTRELQQKEARLRELSTRAILFQEEERRAISRELHDSVGQALTGIRLYLQMLSSQSDVSPQVLQLVSQTLDMTDLTIEEVRRAVQRLGPSVVHEVGLVGALHRLCDTFAEQTPLHLEQELAPCPALSSSVENAIYRIAQEALHNVARHASAQYAKLTLTCDTTTITLTILDDGCGFDTQNMAHSKGRGLQGIQERCELLGGTMTITSAPQQGTRLCVRMPI